MANIGVPQSVLQNNPYSQIKINEQAKVANKAESEEDTRKRVIDSLQGVSSSQNVLYKKDHNKMGKDEFLKLLTHQMQNQDPLKPTDQHKFISDLAQFSQLEQLGNIKAAIEKNKNQANIESKFYAASFLGKSVVTSGGHLNLKPGDRSLDLNFNLPKNAHKAQIRIYDSDHDLVAIVDKAMLAQGPQGLTWDTTSMDRKQAPPGNYTFEVKAWDEEYQPIVVATKTSGIVTGVHFDQGDLKLVVNGKSLSINEVDQMELGLNDKRP